MLTTYEQFKNQAVSEKIVLVRTEASKRLVGFNLFSGSVYSINGFDVSSVVGIEQDGTALTEVGTVSLNAGEFYNDRTNRVLYLRSTDSSNPNGKFIALTRHYFFSNAGIKTHIDPANIATAEVEWLPQVVSTSEFGVELDNQQLEQIGNAIDGSGKVDLINDKDFWVPIFDKIIFENKACKVWSWNRLLPSTEAKLIFSGIIQSKNWSDTKISFTLADQLTQLRVPVELDNIGDIVGVRVPDRSLLYKQRRVYGQVKGHVCLSIDQVTSQGYPLTGTFSVTQNSDVLTGTGTAFLAQLSTGDRIRLSGDTEDITIGETITSDTVAQLSNDFPRGNFTNVTATIIPSHPKRWINREFFVAHHATREPTTTVTASFGVRTIVVVDGRDIEPGDPLIVGGQVVSVQRISGDKTQIKLAKTLTTPVSTGATVVRPSVSHVYLGDDLLEPSRDYSYDAPTGRITLTDTAEFNVSPVKKIRGTTAFTNASRTVTGVGTLFTEDVKKGDWIRCKSETEFFEVLYVQDETTLFLRTPSTYTFTDEGQIKSPEVFNESSSVLSCEVLGKTEDGTKNGEFIRTGPQIVKDLLIENGLSAIIEPTSFDLAKEQGQYTLGLVIPAKVSDTKTKTTRDLITEINKNVFGSLIQDLDFNLQYKIFNPRRPSATLRTVTQADAIGFTIKSEAKRIVKQAEISYQFQEYYGPGRGPVNQVSVATSKAGLYLTKTDKVFQLNTLLTKDDEAVIIARRWAFLLSISSSVISIDSKLQLSDLNVTDIVRLEHPKLYDRVGTSIKTKFAAIQSSRKNGFDTKIELEDLANAFSRCSTIVDVGSPNFDDSTDRDIVLSGYITDDFGLLNSDANTFDVNLIW